MDDVAAKSSVAERSTSPYRTHILVVDDDHSIQELLKTILSLAKYQVSCAFNGRQAVEMMQNNDFDLVITDMVMPGDLSGIDVLRKARELDPNYPVIVITGFLDAETTARTLKLGANDFIPKPFKAGVILSSVATCLR